MASSMAKIVGVAGQLGLLLAWSPSACEVSYFACVDDGQCLLGRDAGRCEANGRCSFPDDGCPSRRSYGEHAPGMIAGACVDEDGDDEDDVEPSSSSDDGASEGTAGPAGDDTGGASGATGESACAQEPSEPNQAEASAEVIDTCGFERTGAIGGADAADWYRLAVPPGCATAAHRLTLVTDAEASVCVTFRCTMPTGSPSAACSGSAIAGDDGALCCDAPELSATFGCDAGTPEYFVAVLADDPACHPYSLTLGDA